MITRESLEKYRLYLKTIQQQLDKFFEEQSPYINCKEGCSHCCEKGEYPYSELEITYLMSGVKTLDTKTIELIEENIAELRRQREQNKESKFLHACPFLVNKRCSLYEYRGLVCRSHGLAFFSKENKLLVPACSELGLNYANVYDHETSMISDEKYRALGIEQEPLAHNVGHHFLSNNETTKALGLDFGDVKTMADWMEI